MSDRVKTAARERGLDLEVCHLEATPRSPDEAAKALGCAMAEVAKSAVYVVDGEPVVCLVAGGDAVDPGLVCDVFDAAEARVASPDEARAATGFPTGAVPPIAHDLRVVFDERLLDHGRIYAAGGDGRTLVEIDPKALAPMIDATVAPIARR
ncbi:MAG: hypothetical protein QOG62_11 [Thermoleophilaceae bacterium]|jgi:prolyl-tRNA editing enzyme YbaK/EbsC (Cys-tRNA(Pro) deacylase)|nr:hypothetical protein [Thermoleophilaceae bacterium]